MAHVRNILLMLHVDSDDPDPCAATRFRSRPTSSTSRPPSWRSQERGTFVRQQRPGAEPSTTSRQVALGEESAVTTAMVRGDRRCVGGRPVLVSLDPPPSGGVLGSWSLQSHPVQRESEDPPPTKKTKHNITKRGQKQRDQLQLALTKKDRNGFFHHAEGRSVCLRWSKFERRRS